MAGPSSSFIPPAPDPYYYYYGPPGGLNAGGEQAYYYGPYDTTEPTGVASAPGIAGLVLGLLFGGGVLCAVPVVLVYTHCKRVRKGTRDLLPRAISVRLPPALRPAASGRKILSAAPAVPSPGRGGSATNPLPAALAASSRND